MPEAPDLEVIKEFLNARVPGAEVAACRVLRPTVVRSLTGDVAEDLPGRSLEGVGPSLSSPSAKTVPASIIRSRMVTGRIWPPAE